MSGSVQQQQSSQQHRKKKQIIMKKKTFDSVTAECELILWYVLWRNNVLFYLSRLIPDLTVRSTSYENSLTKKTKTNTSDCYSLRCNARVKMLWDHLNIPPTSLRQKKKKNTLLIDNNWKAMRNHGKSFQDHKPIWHSWSFIWISSRVCDGVDFPPWWVRLVLSE